MGGGKLFKESCGVSPKQLKECNELFGGATDRGNELRAPYALKAFAIERAVDQGSTWYDMWGLVTPGIARFKAGWGGDVHAYPGALDLDLDPIRGPLVRLALRVRRVAS